MSESGKRNYSVGIMFDEASVEVTKSEKGLDVFDFSGDRPIENGLNFLGVHSKSGWRKNIQWFGCGTHISPDRRIGGVSGDGGVLHGHVFCGRACCRSRSGCHLGKRQRTHRLSPQELR